MRSQTYKTRIGEEILRCLEEHKDKALSVQDICEWLAAQNTETNITTVYRQLDKLVDAKQVITHSGSNGKKILFQYIAQNEECLNHLHIQCTGCSKIVHLDCHESSDFTKHIQAEHGITLDFGKTVIYGLCADCAAAK
ncbi:MAG: transcriptional repressor [Treponema sp.]|nr:transcriptional repressor [Treponema sp.]